MKQNDIKKFLEKWAGRGNEKQDTQQFWNDILYGVLGAPDDTEIQYEKPVKINGKTKFIDGYLPDTRVLIEQKSLGIDLMKAELQSDGMKLTPFEQGQRYGGYLPFDEQPRWIIDSNFEEIRIHDMKKPGEAPEIILLKDLEKDYTRLNFLLRREDEHIQKEFEVSVKAGEIVGVLYDKLLEQFATPEAGGILGEMYNKMLETYDDPDDEHVLQSLNKLCVRIVFCLYAEDAGLFGDNTHAFHDYMAQFNGPARFRNGLKQFFHVLNQKPEDRDRFLDPELAAFPYVNGGLFADEDIELPFFTDDIVDLILEKASEGFDWSDISPTIFGAIFESTLNPDTRRSGGMHYTSIENIHKVIDPLFLDELTEELAAIKAEPIERTRKRKLQEYQNKLAGLKFLDPACGSGNFLTESYLCLRKLENEVIAELSGGQVVMGFEDVSSPIKVSIEQFYGIEINDFACSVAQTAMWIAESKMMKETEALVRQHFDFFPLTTNANIVEGNALRMDWNDVVSAGELSYIMGNPPFVGARRMNDAQKVDMASIFEGWKRYGSMDYVCCWYKCAADMMMNTLIQAAFVSTNSITMGDEAVLLWKPLMSEGLSITFAHRTFNWTSEAKDKAGVHCVIIGFTMNDRGVVKRRIYDDSTVKIASNINAYLMDAPTMFVEGVSKSLSNAPKIGNGNKPLDNAICAFTPEEKAEFIKLEPETEPYFMKYMGSREFINNIDRYFLLINRIPPSKLAKMPHVKNLLEEIRQYRLDSGSKETNRLADTPAAFHYENMPEHDFIAIPQTSSGRRRYVPIGFLSPDVMTNNKLQVMRDGGLYELGLLSSNVHNAWLRTIGGRLRNDYTYSVSVVYNTFPWPLPTDEQKAKIEATAQGILDARAKFPDSSLADLYDELTMPIELRRAHQANDRAVMEAYGFDLKMTEQECVAELMKMYQKLTEGDE